jgi:hypothetical protein
VSRRWLWALHQDLRPVMCSSANTMQVTRQVWRTSHFACVTSELSCPCYWEVSTGTELRLGTRLALPTGFVVVACDLQSLSVHIAGHPEVRATSFKESYACACKVLFSGWHHKVILVRVSWLASPKHSHTSRLPCLSSSENIPKEGGTQHEVVSPLPTPRDLQRSLLKGAQSCLAFDAGSPWRVLPCGTHGSTRSCQFLTSGRMRKEGAVSR